MEYVARVFDLEHVTTPSSSHTTIQSLQRKRVLSHETCWVPSGSASSKTLESDFFFFCFFEAFFAATAPAAIFEHVAASQHGRPCPTKEITQKRKYFNVGNREFVRGGSNHLTLLTSRDPNTLDLSTSHVPMPREKSLKDFVVRTFSSG